MKDAAIAAVLVLLALVAVLLTAARAIRIRRMARCRHLDRVRFWLPKHAFIVQCKACRSIIERGRDTTHRYPDDAPARRGTKRRAA
jgi:hypothetical protein